MATENWEDKIKRLQKQDTKKYVADKKEQPNFLVQARHWEEMTVIEKQAVKELLINKALLTSMDKESVIKKLMDSLEINESAAKKLYNSARQDYFARLPQGSQEAIKNKISEESEELKEKILSDSKADITKQAREINLINKTLADIHQLGNAPASVAFTFQTNVNEGDLIKNSFKTVEAEAVDPDELKKLQGETEGEQKDGPVPPDSN